MVAHGAVLRKNFFKADELIAIVTNFRNAGLSKDEVALMSFARKVAIQAHQVSESDIDELRTYGLSDKEVLDVILVSTARSFFSKTLDAVGAVPDKIYTELEPELLHVLSLDRTVPTIE